MLLGLRVWDLSLVVKSVKSFNHFSTALEVARLRLQARHPVDWEIFVPTSDDVVGDNPPLMENMINREMKRLFDELGHASSITIKAPQAYIHPLLCLRSPTWEKLECLHIELWSTFDLLKPYTNPGGRINMFAKADKLRKLYLGSEYLQATGATPYYSFVTRVVIPWSQLTHLVIRDASDEIATEYQPSSHPPGEKLHSHRDHIREIFRKCAPSIEVCHIRTIGWFESEALDSSEDADQDIINFLHLEEFFLDCGTAAHTAQEDSMLNPMLFNTKLPALKLFRLWTSAAPKFYEFDDELLGTVVESHKLMPLLITIQERSFFALEKFQLVNAGVSSMELASFLRLVPTLEVLDLRLD